MPLEANQFHSTDHTSALPAIPASISDTAAAFRLLLVDGNAGSLVRHQLTLSNSSYCVVTATTCFEIISLRRVAVHLAVLNENLGWSALRNAAESVRRTWPSAQILVIGAAQHVLDDPLYDEAVDRQTTPVNLLSVLRKLSYDLIPNLSLHFGSKNEFANFEPSSEAKRVPAVRESDPSKEAEHETTPREEPRDLPAEERRG